MVGRECCLDPSDNAHRAGDADRSAFVGRLLNSRIWWCPVDQYEVCCWTTLPDVLSHTVIDPALCRCVDTVHIQVMRPLICRITSKARHRAHLRVSCTDEARIRDIRDIVLPLLMDLLQRRETWGFEGFQLEASSQGVLVHDQKSSARTTLHISENLAGVRICSPYMCAVHLHCLFSNAEIVLALGS